MVSTRVEYLFYKKNGLHILGCTIMTKSWLRLPNCAGGFVKAVTGL